MITLAALNALPGLEAEAGFVTCCAARAWARGMLAKRPFSDTAQLHQAADDVCAMLAQADWLEAFAAHPRIGEAAHHSATAHWSQQEQRRVDDADAHTKSLLVAGNRDYDARFGFVFLVCATGKSAAQMLALLHGRLDNDRDTEIRVAADEQRKITHLRIDKWVQP